MGHARQPVRIRIIGTDEAADPIVAESGCAGLPAPGARVQAGSGAFRRV